MGKIYTKNKTNELYSWGLRHLASYVWCEDKHIFEARMLGMSNETLRNATSIFEAVAETVPYKYKGKKVEPAPEDKELVEELGKFVRFRFTILYCARRKTKEQIIDTYKKCTAKYVGTLYDYKGDKKEPCFYYLVEADGKKSVSVAGSFILKFWELLQQEPMFIDYFAS